MALGRGRFGARGWNIFLHKTMVRQPIIEDIKLIFQIEVGDIHKIDLRFK